MPKARGHLADRLARWVATLRAEDLPRDVISDARLRLLDVLGLILAARDGPIGHAVRTAAAALGRGDAARIVGTNDITSASLAALVNGTLAHAMDFDDTHNPSVMHPSAVSVPAALAVAQARGLNGRDLLLGIVIGNEVGCRLGLVGPGAFHDVGQHPTSVLGTTAAALAAGRLLGLDARRLAWAVGISASQGAGVLEAYSDGTWSKTLHPGWAAHGGITAATLAHCGFTGPRSGLDGRYGLFRTHVQHPPRPFDYAVATEDLGSRWHMLETAFKIYPCAHSIHAFAEAAFALRKRHEIRADRIAGVVLEIDAGFVGQIAEPRAAKLAPATTTHARASVIYAVATALARGSLGMDDYTDAALHRPDVLALAPRIRHHVIASSGATIRFSGTVTITMTDGETHALTIAEADGTGRRPLSARRVEAKFRGCVDGVLSDARAKTVIALCRTIETLPAIDDLLAATAPVDSIRP